MGPTLYLFGGTHVGLVRKANEDAYLIFEPNEQPELLQGRGRLVIVADGMGGTVGGAHASRLVVQTVRDVLYSNPTAPVQPVMGEALRQANRVVHMQQLERPDLKGMGSTCTAMVLHQGQAFIGHVGDSRAYLIRDGRILQLTDDHTKIELLLKSGMITPAEAAHHPERSVLVRSIGPKPEVEPDVLQPIKLQHGDRFVLCSDGLINHVPDPQILSTVLDAGDAHAVKALIDKALAGGGSDNCTVVLVTVGVVHPAAVKATAAPATVHEAIGAEVTDPEWAPVIEDEGPRKTPPMVFVLSALAGFLLAVAFFFWLDRPTEVVEETTKVTSTQSETRAETSAESSEGSEGSEGSEEQAKPDNGLEGFEDEMAQKEEATREREAERARQRAAKKKADEEKAAADKKAADAKRLADAQAATTDDITQNRDDGKVVDSVTVKFSVKNSDECAGTVEATVAEGSNSFKIAANSSAVIARGTYMVYVSDNDKQVASAPNTTPFDTSTKKLNYNCRSQVLNIK